MRVTTSTRDVCFLVGYQHTDKDAIKEKVNGTDARVV